MIDDSVSPMTALAPGALLALTADRLKSAVNPAAVAATDCC